MARLDMSDCMEMHFASRLVGYLGYDEGGLLS